MKRTWTMIGLSLLASFFGSQAVWAKDAPTSGAQLLNQLETAVKAKDKDAIMALYNWGGVAAWVKADQSDRIADWLTRKLKDAKLSPLPAHFSSSGEHGDIHFSLNVQPTGIIQLGFTDGFGVGFPFGKQGDAYYLAGVVTKLIAHPHSNTNGLMIRVQTPNGQPVSHALVAAGSASRIPGLHFRTLYGGDFLTDDNGEFRLPPTETNRFLVASNGRCFGWLQSAELTNHAVMVLRPWGRIEGLLKNRNHVLANIPLELRLDPQDFSGRGLIPPVRLLGEETTTDKHGRFVFQSVPPLKFRFRINRHDRQTPFGMYLCDLTVIPGESNHVEINLHGRSITGRVVKGPGLDKDLDLGACSGTLSSVTKDSQGVTRDVYFRVGANGSFHAELVEPGNYRVTGDLWGKSARLAYLDPVVVHVPNEDSDADVPFDIGTVTLKKVVNLKPGDKAPDFSVKDLEGKSFKLSDYRGKYVLLDFWATWCGPCVGETPNLKATYDAFGKSKRFVMISLSLDSSPAAPRRFAQEHGIAWKQGFLGNWSSDKITPTYGVFGIPAIFLLAPDGRVVATDLRGAKIKEAVAAALAR